MTEPRSNILPPEQPEPEKIEWTDNFLENMRLLKSREQRQQQPASSPVPASSNPAYVDAAAKHEIDALASCPSGGRNDQLNKAALKLGRLPIDRGYLRTSLIDACHANGLIADDGVRSVEATIASGFGKADREGPRVIPAPVNGHAVPGSGNRSGTGNHAAVPGSVPLMREPGTDDEKPLYVDISAMLDGTVPEPPEPALLCRGDGRKLFYSGQVNLLFGDPESGKTWVCLACAVEELKAGRKVIIIDLDHNGAQSTVHRLLALGAPQERLRDPAVFRYCEPEDRLELRQVVADSVAWRPAVAVVDSIGELLPMHGANTNSADEFTAVHSSVLKPLAKAGAAVLAVDHLAKGADSRAQGPGGTAAKRRAIGGVSIRVKATKAFTPGHGGEALLLINKDRHGGVRAHCPVGDREPVAGAFKLLAFSDGVLEWAFAAPSISQRNPDEAASTEDVAALSELDPPPQSVEDARERLGWRKQRAANAMRTWRQQHGNPPEPAQ